MAYYDVRKGRKTGIFESWAECREQIFRFSGAVYKSFMTLEEAKAYIEHPILRERLIKAAQVLLEIDKPIFDVFSNLGVMKLRTCMLLFASISDEPVFKQVINKYHW